MKTYSEEKALSVLRYLLAFRRVMQFKESCHDHDHQKCFATHFSKLQQSIVQSQRICFVIPAFPAKSPNRDKTETMMPDLGEVLALQFLNNVCEQIAKIYSPGAEVVICSDGRVFNDLVKVSDADVNHYMIGIREMIKHHQLTHLSTYSLDDVYQGEQYADMRNKLIALYGDDLSDLKNRVRTQEKDRLLFNGIHRFIFEDQRNLWPELSNNRIRNVTKKIAYQVIQRSNAWSSFIQERFQQAVRLSIHPQVCGSEKLGIHLVHTKDAWATPWHSVVVKSANKYTLLKKKEAEQLGAKAVYCNEQFSHYILEATS